MSRMGAPEKMARELGRLHRNLPGVCWAFLLWRRACCCLCYMGFAISGRIPCMILCGLAGPYPAVCQCAGCFGSHHPGLSLGVEVQGSVLLIGHGLFCVVSSITQYFLWYTLFTLLFCLTLDIPAALAMDTPFLLDFALEGVSPWLYFSQWRGWNMDWMYNVQLVLSFLPLVLAVVDFICAAKSIGSTAKRCSRAFSAVCR